MSLLRQLGTAALWLGGLVGLALILLVAVGVATTGAGIADNPVSLMTMKSRP